MGNKCCIAIWRPADIRRRQAGAIASAIRRPSAYGRTVLEFLHAGDVLMVTRIDRLARSIGDLQVIVALSEYAARS
jgi:hypothetical protein